MKFLKGWRTVVANILMSLPLLADVLFQIAQLPEMKAVIPNEYLPWYALGVVVANIILRKITTTPMGQK